MTKGIKGLFALTLGYLLWNLFFYYLILTIVLFILIPSSPSIQEIHETLEPYLIYIFSCASLFYFLIFKGYLGLTKRFFKFFYTPYLVRGILVSLVIVFSFFLSRIYLFNGLVFDRGSFVQITFQTSSYLLFFVSFLFCDEYILRKVLLEELQKNSYPLTLSVIIVALTTASLMWLRFDILPMEFISFFILGCFLTLLKIHQKSFGASAGFITGFLTIPHVIFGFPILKQEYTSLFITQWNPGLQSNLIIILTGGQAGFLSSLTLQFVLLLFVIISWIRIKNQLKYMA